MRLEIDEHHQHKDVYQHSLVVLRQAIDQETDGPDLVLRLAALLHDIGKPATRRYEAGGGVSFHHHEVVGAKTGPQALAGPAVPEGRDRGRGHAGVPAPAVPRLRQGRVDRLGGAPLRDRRRPAAVPAAQAGPRRLHDPQQAQGRGAARRPTTTWSGGSTRIAAEEDLARVRPDLDGNEIMRLLGVPPGPLVGQAWRFLKDLRLDRGPLAARRGGGRAVRVGPGAGRRTAAAYGQARRRRSTSR